MQYSMAYSKNDLNRVLAKKITRKLVVTATIMVGLGLLDKAL